MNIILIPKHVGIKGIILVPVSVSHILSSQDVSLIKYIPPYNLEEPDSLFLALEF